LNLLWIPVVYLFYPETKDRSLESIESMFSTGPLYWQMEKAFAENEEVMREQSVIGAQIARRKSVESGAHKEYDGEV